MLKRVGVLRHATQINLYSACDVNYRISVNFQCASSEFWNTAIDSVPKFTVSAKNL